MIFYNVNRMFGVRTSIFADLCYWSLVAITAANYSFITFTLSGDVMFSGPLKPLAYSRLPIAIIGFFFLVAKHKKGLSIGPMSGLLTALVLSVTLSVPLSPAIREAAIYGVWFVFMVLFLSKYTYYLVEQGGLAFAKYKLVLPLMFYGLYFLVLTLFSLPEYVLGRPFPALFSTRTQVAMIAPLFLGGMACCYYMIKQKKVMSFALLGGVVFCLAVLAVSGKRASIVCALLIGAAYFVFTMRASGKLVLVAVLPMLLFLVFSSGFDNTARDASEFTMQRVEKGFDSKTATSINARLYIWDIVGESVTKYPLGVGLNVGRVLVGGGLHNTYLGYLLETGWISFVLVMIIIALSGLRSWFSNNNDKRNMLLFIMLPCLLYSITEYNTAPGQPLFIPFWVAIAYGLMPRLPRSEPYRRRAD